MRNVILTFTLATSLAACSATPESGAFASRLRAQTAGVAVVACFARFCGGKRVDEFEDS